MVSVFMKLLGLPVSANQYNCLLFVFYPNFSSFCFIMSLTFSSLKFID